MSLCYRNNGWPEHINYVASGAPGSGRGGNLGQTGQPQPGMSATLWGLKRWQLRQAIHKIKAGHKLGGNDKVIVHSDGKVTDVNGSEIGNIFDEI
jgi:hypothetical protein